MKLESITPGLSLTGIEAAHIVSVVATVPLAEGSIQLIYRTPEGAMKERLLGRADEAMIEIAATERPFFFDGDGAAFQNALRESEARFHELADNISQFAWTADARGWIYWYNKRWYDYTGTTLPQMQGWGWQKVHHPDHVNRVVQRIRHSFENGTPWEDIFPLRSREGDYRWFLSRALPIRNEAREVIRWFGTNTDVTEQIEAEKALRESEARFRELADNISQFAWTADAQGWIYWYNRRWHDYTGTTLEEMQGWGWQTVHHPDHVNRVVERIRHSFEAGTPWEDTFPLRSKDGDYRWFLSRALPIRNEAGDVIRWFGTNTDVTEQVEAEKALRESEARLALANTMLERERDNKLLSVQAITASIAHEIRQPLGAISLNAESALQCLKRTPPDHDEVSDALIDIMQSVKSTTEVLDGLRTLFGKGDQGRGPVDVNQLIRSVLQLVGARTKNQRVDVQLELADGLPLVVGHGGQLREVIYNLVNNAIEAMDSAPDRRRLLSIRTELRSEPVIAVSVEDTGPGIDSARIEEIFAPFATTKAKGTGLGLAICRMIVEGHGGQLTAASDGKSGASFQFVLPIRHTER